MRINLEANQDPSGIYFKMRLREPRSSKRISQENKGVCKESVKRTRDFKKKQLGDQENDLNHKCVTCLSKESVRSCIMVLGTTKAWYKDQYVQGAWISMYVQDSRECTRCR
jgi:hypothetical protein